MDLLKKAIRLALQGRLWLLPLDCREEVGLTINKERTILLMYPDEKYLSGERATEATLLGHYMMHSASSIDNKQNKSHFERWFKKFAVIKKGKNK